MKTKRQSKIIDIIAVKDIETQEQLLEALALEGIRATQATISRDIKELRIIKEQTSLGTYRYAISTKETTEVFSKKLNTIFKQCVVSFDHAQNIIVIKTLPGLGSAAASAIDAMHMTTVVGTLAGDDTALVIMRDSTVAAAFCAEIQKFVE